MNTLRARSTSALLLSLLALGCGKSAADGPQAAAAIGAGKSPTAAATEGGAKQRAARGAEHAVFSLGDNRLLAHALAGGGLVLRPGHASFAKYTRFARAAGRWSERAVIDGHAVARPESYAQFDVPLAADEAARAKVIALRVHAPAAQRVTVMAGGQAAGAAELVPGWQTATIAVANGRLVAGENNLQLVWGKGARPGIAWIQVGGASAIDAAPVGWDKDAFALGDGAGLAWYVQVPKDGRLVGDVVGDGCKVDVRVTAHGSAALTGTLSGAGGAVELGTLGGQVARLELVAGGCPSTRLANAALALPGAAPSVTAAKRPKNVIFWIMDSLRADRVPTFMPGARPETPVFDRLATTGAAFQSNYTQGNESRASHASMWTSQFVGNHRMIPGGEKTVSSRWFTLGEAMKRAGLYTSGVSANGYITAKWGFGEGWDAYRNHIHDGGGVTGAAILGKGIESLTPKKDAPFFLYLGTIDTHVSWRAKEPWFSKYDPKPYSGKFQTELTGLEAEKFAKSKQRPSERDIERIVAIYDSNVSYQDDLLGKLFEQLTAWGIADDTMVIVTADHGDEQWEEGRVGHGGSTRESVVRVPLLIHYPPLFPGGKIDEGVDTLDVLPTIYDALGQKPVDEWQGESLLPLAQGRGRGYPRPSITSQYEFAWAMRLGGWKVRVAGSGVPDLFHVAKDPLERTRLTDDRPVERRFLTDAFSLFLANQKVWRKRVHGVASNMTAAGAEALEGR